MHTIIEPIKEELRTFGLNPTHWEAAEFLDPSRLILVHREDSDVRLAINLLSEPEMPTILAIENVEWLIAGA